MCVCFVFFFRGDTSQSFEDCVPRTAGLKLHVGSLKVLRYGWRFLCVSTEEF